MARAFPRRRGLPRRRFEGPDLALALLLVVEEEVVVMMSKASSKGGPLPTRNTSKSNAAD